MGIDLKSIQSRAMTGSLPTSTASGGGGGPAVPEGTFVTKIKAAGMANSQKGEPQLTVDLVVKDVVELGTLEEGVTEDMVKGRDFRMYFLANAAVEADVKWAERLIGDVVAIAGQVGIDTKKVFADAEGDEAKSVKEIFLNFAQVASRMLTKGADMGTVTVKRIRQAKNPKYFNHEIVQGQKAAPAKKSAATEGL